MATILGLALKINADASAVPAALTPVEKALQQLDKEAERVTGVFDQFAQSSSAAADIQKRLQSEIASLTAALKAGDITGQEFADGFAAIKRESLASADALRRADQVISDTRTDLETFIDTQKEYQQLLQDGLLPLDNYTRAVQDAAAGLSGADLAAAAEASGVELTALASASDNASNSTINLGDSIRILPGFLGGFVTSSTDFVNNATQIAERMDRLTQLMGDFATVVPLAARALSFLTTPIGLAASAVAVSGGVAAGLSRMEEAAQRLTNTANKLGVSFQFIETLQQAALVTGVSFETVNSATTRLLRSLANADEESNKAAQALSNLGISLTDLQENDTEGTIRAIATRLTTIEDPAKRATAAVAIFGKSGTELLPFLSSLKEAEDTLDRFNGRLSTLDRDRVLSLGESFNAVSAALRGIGNEALTPFIGIANSIADGLAPVITEVGRSIGTVLDLLSPFTSSLGAVVNVFGQLVGIGLKGVNLFFEPLAMVFRGLSSVVEGVSKSITSFFKSISPVAEQTRKVIQATTKTAQELAKAMQDAIAAGSKSIDDAIRKAGEFGQTGFRAAQEFQRAVSRLNSELADIGAKEYQRRLAEVTAEFEKQLDRAKSIRFELDRALKAEQDRKDATSATAEEILKQLEAQQKQNELLAFVGAVPEQATALQQKIALEQEIFKVQEQAAQARSANDLDAAAAADRRIEKLREAAALENQRLSGEKTSLEIETKRLEKEQQRRNRVEEILQLRRREDESARKLLDIEASLREAQDKASVEQSRADAEVQRIARTNAAATQEDFRKILTNPALAKATDTVRELTAVRNEIIDAQAAADAGFNDGFQKAFAETDKLIQSAIEKTKGFGKEGVAASVALADGIKAAQGRAVSGILTRPTFDAEIARVQKVFDAQLLRIQELANRELENQRLVVQSRQSANERVEAFLRSQVDQRTQLELRRIDEITNRERQALENVRAIRERIAVTEKSVAAARDIGDLKSARARAAELRLLKQAEVSEQRIADGRNQQQRNINQQFLGGINRAQQFQGLVAQSNETFLRSFNNTYAGANQALAASSAAAAEQAAKLERLLTPTNQLAQTADIRTAEGQQLLLGLTQQGQDPALIEARLQTKSLNTIAQGITQAASNYFNAPVAIVGGAQFG